jgi:hypothetical protein
MITITEGKEEEEFRRFQLWLAATEAMYGAINATEPGAAGRNAMWPHAYSSPPEVARSGNRALTRPIFGPAAAAIGRALQRAADGLEAWGAPPEREECASR